MTGRKTVPAARMLASLLLLAFAAASLRANEADRLVDAWLDSQKNVASWSADFVQTRSLKTFAQPLVSSGQVWFAAPDRFRWELGNPPQTIAAKNPGQLLVIYPKLQRAEKYPLDPRQSGRWKDALSLLEAGFPRSREELESQFRIRQTRVLGDAAEVVLEPRSSAARRLMREVKVGFDTANFGLRWTELEFGDGSTLRNDFRNPTLNPALNETLFSPAIPTDYKIVEPLKSNR